MTKLHTPMNLEDVQKYVKQIFDLECQVIDSRWKIRALEFELSLQKQLYSDLKRFSLEIISMR